MVRYISINKLHTRKSLLLLMPEDVASSVTSSILPLRSSRWLLSLLILKWLLRLGMPWYCCGGGGLPRTTLSNVRSKTYINSNRRRLDRPISGKPAGIGRIADRFKRHPIDESWPLD